MRRWLPSPVLSAALLVGWLLLAQSISPAHWLLGGVLAVALPLLAAPMRPTPGRMRRPLVLVRLIATVGADVVRSALAVGSGVLDAGKQLPRSRFVLVPLALRDPHALAALAVITAVVPGTVWCELAPDRNAFRLHVFDVEEDDEAFVARFKARYERPLQEIFE
jgi:multicomponent K+:H+ antiporter subunit E